MARMHVLVKGRVQGIGFRWFVRDIASEMGVSGWVRNLPDRDVELEAQATPGVLSAFIAELRTAHPYARVDSMETQELTLMPNEQGFTIR